jgi:amidase
MSLKLHNDILVKLINKIRGGYVMAAQRVHSFTDDVLADYDATGIAELIRERKISAEEAAVAAIARARKVNGELDAIEVEAYERALAESRIPKSGIFAGVPTFIKDNVDVIGMPTRHGSRATSAKPARRNDPFVSQFMQLGFTVLGKSRLPEFGFNATTECSGRSPAHNPWNTAYSTGGSSGGSAALVASGVVPVAHGNDGGGSIRIPSSCNGLIGMKPTRGRFIFSAMASTLPVKIVGDGLLTRSVRDTARFYHGMEQIWRNKKLAPVGEVTGPGKKRLRIGLVVDSITGIPTCPETRKVINDTAVLMESLGHRVDPMKVPVDKVFIEDFTLYWGFLAFSISTFGRLILSFDFDASKLEPFSLGLAQYFRKHMMKTPGMLYRLSRGAADYDAALAGYDAVLSPVLAHAVAELGYLHPDVEFDELFRRLIGYVSFTPVNNASGSPAITLPMGASANGVPIGVQFMAANGQERTLLEIAYEIEEARPWRKITG